MTALSARLPPFRAPFVVVGTAFLDVHAFWFRPPRPCSPGEITVCAGGSGRNLAESLARLGCQASLVSAVGDDLAGRWILDETRNAGVDVARVSVIRGGRSGQFSAMMRPDGGLEQAVVAAEIRSRIEPAAAVKAIGSTTAAGGSAVLELALPARTLDAAIAAARDRELPVCLEVASTPSPEVARRRIEGAALLKGTENELRALAGVKERGEPAGLRAAGIMLDRGARCVLMTRGSRGAILAEGDELIELTHGAVDRPRIAGAGDAFLAGVLWASDQRLPWDACLRAGAACARAALGSPRSAPAELSPETLAGGWGEVAGGASPWR